MSRDTSAYLLVSKGENDDVKIVKPKSKSSKKVTPSSVEDLNHVDEKGEVAQKNDHKPNENEKKDEKPPMVSYGDLFRFASKFDVLLMVLGTLGSIGQGALIPVQFIIFGELTDSFTLYTQCNDFGLNDTACNTLNIEDEMIPFSYYYIGIACGMAAVVALQMICWGLTAERQVYEIRKAFFQSILRQDMGWFDTNDAGELNSRLADDVSKIADGIGHKFALFLYGFSGFISGYALGFAYGWKLTLVILSLFPLTAASGGFIGWMVTAFTTKELSAYSKAGSIAQEAISSHKTVAAFGAQDKETERYTQRLGEARSMGEKKGLTNGIGMGVFNVIMFGSYALAFWYGAKLIVAKETSGGNILIVFFCVMFGSVLAGQTAPSMQSIAVARGAAYHIYLIIDRTPVIDISSKDGVIPDELEGHVQFKDVKFKYPSRPDVQILNGFTLSVSSGSTVALVGESGCGKSTVVKLIQRFYEAEEGTVNIDNRNVEAYHLKWLRQHIGVVSQEPILFSTSIAENIRYGRDDATQEEIEKAAKEANAHDFITAFPKGYETVCGERGAQMSGGQKQRIAIARALIRNPKILLLDEATSALDTESESIVQEALDKARQGRTTFVIAHRLSTVRNADMIVAVKEGAVVETGTHDELMQLNGVYKELVSSQIFDEEEDDEEEEKEVIDEDLTKKTHVTVTRSVSVPGDHKHRATLQRMDSKVLEEEVEPTPALRILKMSSTEWPHLIAGTFGAALNGAFPFVFAFLLGEILGVFSKNPDIPEQRQEMKDESLFWSLLFLALGVGSFVGNLLQFWMYAIAGEILTERLRHKAFKCTLRQECSFFDDPYHSTGALTSNLATHASAVQGATGARVGTLASSLITAIGCLTIAFVSGWKLALVILAFLPFIIIGGAMEMKIFFGTGSPTVGSEAAGKIAVEAISNIHTVATLTKETHFFEKYVNAIEEFTKKKKRKAVISGLFMGLTQSFFLLSNAAAFRFAGYLVQRKEMSFVGVMKTIFSVQFGALVVGQFSSFTPDYVKAKIAATRMFKLFDRVPAIDIESDEGLRPDKVDGEIEFKKVVFRYPFRRDVKVLREFNLVVEPGKTVALVGSSGCGKSTTVSLIPRFYDVESGSVMIDGKDVKSLSVSWLRRQIGIVSQEPILFNLSIGENIAYGNLDGKATQEEIETAAKAANIHDFISSLPEGYDTIAGDKGTLISGGQKQRIAIARALLRNPRILLLDEATSALDTESEKVVQEALDKASVGRTTLIIAHRLSTVQKADKIAVIKHGHVIEQGTHQQLMEMKGNYYRLQQRVEK